MHAPSQTTPAPRPVRIWLVIGVVMIFFQVVIGGVTRLTGSGLSITKWEIVLGTFPPLNAEQWQAAFDAYQATPQYQKINEGMSLSDFKFIYFWEYFHRLWARTMGFVFLIPFILFWRKGWLSRQLMRRLGIVALLAALAASLGWIMVASGLVNRPWVNAYKLTLHLSVALSCYGFLLWTTFGAWNPSPELFPHPGLRKLLKTIFLVAAVQIVLGGIVSGMKAAMVYPTWPDMHGALIPDILLDIQQWNVENFVQYDSTPFMPALIQLMHRTTAYLLVGLVLIWTWRAYPLSRHYTHRFGIASLPLLIGIQAVLGIFTLIYSVGIIPVGLGVFHQAGALCVLSILLYLLYFLPVHNKKV